VTNPTSASATPPPAPIDQDALWSAWRALADKFTLVRMLTHISFSRAAWGVYGVDVITRLRTTPAAASALRQLADTPEEVLKKLAGLAAVNARRNEAMWRMAALFYVTVPLTLLLAGLEGAPDVVKDFLKDSAPILVGGGVAMTFWLLVYFANQWRARQVEAVVELARIERGLGLDGQAGSP